MLENLNAMMAVSDDNLGKLSQLLSAIAEGDLTARMHGDYQGVFARMRDDANTTVTQLTQIVGQIQASASSITLAAGEIASGKSSSVSSILQRAVSAKAGEYQGLNNSHILIFDLHSEYAAAFPNASVITVDDLVLPYWLLNEDEMEDMFLESGDNNNYNQEALLRQVVTIAKKISNPGPGRQPGLVEDPHRQRDRG